MQRSHLSKEPRETPRRGWLQSLREQIRRPGPGRSRAIALLVVLLAVLAVIVVVNLANRETRPRAPALTRELIYQNKQEGFRFLPPEGWAIRARAEVPSGRLTEERLLAEYKLHSADQPGSLEVSMADLPAGPTADCLSSTMTGPAPWQLLSGPETMEINSLPASRAIFASPSGSDKLLREVVAIRRGERVYFFVGLYLAKDARCREQIRQAVASVTW
jgi:hypothetical protein